MCNFVLTKAWGFFCDVSFLSACISLSADELDEAFTELSSLVKAYLGLEPPTAFDSIQDTNSRAGAGTVSGHMPLPSLSVEYSYVFVTRIGICE